MPMWLALTLVAISVLGLANAESIARLIVWAFF